MFVIFHIDMRKLVFQNNYLLDHNEDTEMIVCVNEVSTTTQ